MKKWVVVMGVCIVAVAAQSWATENGGGAYPNGAEDFMTGALPPPGDYLVAYGLYYKAGDLMDDAGNERPIPFDVTVWGVVPRLIHVTKTKVLGASWAQHVFVPLLSLDVTTPGGSDDKIGLGDIIVDPIILGWHKPPFHCAAGVDVYLPVGDYDKQDIANTGRNYWTFEPVFACTYLNKQGIDVSAKLMYDINLENSDPSVGEEYESGDEFHADYAIGKHIKNWTVGACGYFYKQVSSDDGMVMTPGGPADAGDNKGQTIAAGPIVAYQHGPMSLTLKYQQEVDTENRPEGYRAWVKLIAPF